MFCYVFDMFCNVFASFCNLLLFSICFVMFCYVFAMSCYVLLASGLYFHPGQPCQTSAEVSHRIGASSARLFQLAFRICAAGRSSTYRTRGKPKDMYATNLIVVRLFRVNSQILTSKFWFSHGLISQILV